MNVIERRLRGLLEGTALARPLRRVVRVLRPSWHREQKAAARAYAAFLGGYAARLQAELAAMPTTRRALVVGYVNPKLAAFQAPLIFALRMAGFHVTVPMPMARGVAADFYRALGANAILVTEDLARPADRSAVRGLRATARDPEQLIALAYRNVPIGRFVASTLMRQRRLGSVDPRMPDLDAALTDCIAASVRAVDLAEAMVSRVRPELVCFYDRGYTPDGELFEVALAGGAKALTLNAAHRSGFVMSKRYHPGNKDRHFGAPSAATWNALKSMNWTAGHWQALRTEIESSYKSGTWYDEVGTQFGKTALTGDALLSSLGLDPARKTAVLFPHLFWDATFFWGDDLFADYRDWFCQVLRAAAANDRVNWIVKLHPASVVKDRRDGYTGEPAEMIAMRETLGTLPKHVAFMPPDSPVSTLSLYQIVDYCLTVRGTVGIEAAMYGIPVLTAGTGRYDGYGFTIDSSSREAYLARLSALETIAPLTEAQTELARRYAYGLFMLRPLELQTMRFHYRQDASATLDLALDLPGDRAIRDMPDIARLAEWLAGEDDDLAGERIGDETAKQSQFG
jgi:Capsule polysaccharide biosynthesis protein